MNLGKLKLSVNKNVPADNSVSGATAEVAKPATESVPAVPAVAAKPAGIKLGGLRLPARAPDRVADSTVPAAGTAVAIPESVPEVVGEDEPAPINTPQGFQAMLDRLDAMIIAGQGVTQLTLDTCRKYVGNIYKELKANPNLDEIFKDRDMHNVMAVVQRSTLQAKETIQQKKTKAETSAKKKALLNPDFGDMDFGFGDDTPNQTATAVAVSKAKAGDLMGFSDINTDEIAAQVAAARKK